MELLIKQMRQAQENGLYLLALMAALALPDMCAALGDPAGKTSPSKYKKWVTTYTELSADDAELLYGFRCSLLHEGSAHPHKSNFPVAFVEPSPHYPQLHNLSTVVGDSDRVAWISVSTFVEDIAKACEGWLTQFGGSTTVQRNIAKFVRHRPEGLPPHVVGVPVVA